MASLNTNNQPFEVYILKWSTAGTITVIHSDVAMLCCDITVLYCAAILLCYDVTEPVFKRHVSLCHLFGAMLFTKHYCLRTERRDGTAEHSEVILHL